MIKRQVDPISCCVWGCLGRAPFIWGLSQHGKQGVVLGRLERWARPQRALPEAYPLESWVVSVLVKVTLSRESGVGSLCGM